MQIAVGMADMGGFLPVRFRVPQASKETLPFRPHTPHSKPLLPSSNSGRNLCSASG